MTTVMTVPQWKSPRVETGPGSCLNPPRCGAKRVPGAGSNGACLVQNVLHMRHTEVPTGPSVSFVTKLIRGACAIDTTDMPGGAS